MCFCASRSITCFTAILFWIVLDVRLLPELVRPGLVAELQLRTVPFSNCLPKILRIVDVAGSLIPGNLTLKRWRRSGKKFLPPLLLMIFHHKEVPVLEVKLWCHQSTYKKLCKEFRLIRSTTGYLCLVFKILRRNRRRSGGRGGLFSRQHQALRTGSLQVDQEQNIQQIGNHKACLSTWYWEACGGFQHHSKWRIRFPLQRHCTFNKANSYIHLVF